MFAAKGGGWLLDHDPRWLRALFPLAAVLGILGHVFISRIRWRRDGEGPEVPEPGVRGALAAMGRAWAQALRVLRRDRDFFLFEAAFMLYGFALLMSTPLVVIYAEGDLGLTYGEWTWASGFASPLAQLASVFLVGRLSDRLGLARSTSLAFLLLVGFFAVLPLVTGANGLIASYVALGVAMAGVNVGWNLGPLRFAPIGRSRTYTSVHVLLVGVRSGTAPVVGYLAMKTFGIRITFGVSAVMMALAFLLMWWLARRVRL
jgi:predicted MFS family arabinose efflux permease